MTTHVDIPPALEDFRQRLLRHGVRPLVVRLHHGVLYLAGRLLYSCGFIIHCTWSVEPRRGIRMDKASTHQPQWTRHPRTSRSVLMAGPSSFIALISAASVSSSALPPGACAGANAACAAAAATGGMEAGRGGPFPSCLPAAAAPSAAASAAAAARASACATCATAARRACTAAALICPPAFDPCAPIVRA